MRRVVIVALMMWAYGGMLSALALDLDSLKSQGVIGEKQDGYVGIVANPTPELQQFVAEINGKRKAKYAEISGGTGQAQDVVEKLAAQSLIERLPAGAFYESASGWAKK